MVKFGSGLGIVSKMGTVLPLIVLSSHLRTELFLFWFGFCLVFLVFYFNFRKGGEKEKCVFLTFSCMLWFCIFLCVHLFHCCKIRMWRILTSFFLQLYIGDRSDAELIWGGWKSFKFGTGKLLIATNFRPWEEWAGEGWDCSSPCFFSLVALWDKHTKSKFTSLVGT